MASTGLAITCMAECPCPSRISSWLVCVAARVVLDDSPFNQISDVRFLQQNFDRLLHSASSVNSKVEGQCKWFFSNA